MKNKTKKQKIFFLQIKMTSLINFNNFTSAIVYNYKFSQLMFNTLSLIFFFELYLKVIYFEVCNILNFLKNIKKIENQNISIPTLIIN